MNPRCTGTRWRTGQSYSPHLVARRSGEIEAIRAAGRVVAAILGALREKAAPEVSPRDLDALARDLVAEAGATPSFLGYHPGWASRPYPSVICASVNDAVVHGRSMHEAPFVPNTRSGRAVPHVMEATAGPGARRVLVISGSTRSASTNTAFCRTAVRSAPPGVTVSCFLDVAGLPHFNPDDDHQPLPPAVAILRSRIAEADAVLFSTPEYAGTLPGSFKNLLDWMVGGTELTGKPVAWIKVAADARCGEGAHATLATVLAYVQADIVHHACRHIPIGHGAVGPDGLVADPSVHEAIVQSVQAVLEHASRAMTSSAITSSRTAWTS